MEMLSVICMKDNCQWRLHASIIRQFVIFMIRKFNNVHIYSIEVRRNAHLHASSSVIIDHILEQLDNSNRSYDLPLLYVTWNVSSM